MAASLHICSSLIVAIKHEILPTLAAHPDTAGKMQTSGVMLFSQ